jgi:hypothetical protein
MLVAVVVELQELQVVMLLHQTLEAEVKVVVVEEQTKDQLLVVSQLLRFLVLPYLDKQIRVVVVEEVLIYLLITL